MTAKTLEPHIGSGVLDFVTSFFTTIGAVFTSLSVARQCAAEYENLSMLSDAELADRGLKRGDLVHYAYAKYLKD